MRLISLCPSLTELVFDLGRGQDLIGRTRYCIEPADRIEAVEALGGTKDPELARIVALAPDLVLLNREENRVEDHDATVALLAELGYASVWSKHLDETTAFSYLERDGDPLVIEILQMPV